MLLFLSDVSGSEVLLILIFVLIFFGAKSIPSLAKTLGKAMYQIKNASNELQNEIKKSGLDIKNDMNFSNVFKDTTEAITNPIANEINDMNHAIHTPVGVKAFGSEFPEVKQAEKVEDENAIVENKVKVTNNNQDKTTEGEINPNL